MKRIIVIGHRGAAGLEPENTLRAFRRGCELGVDRVETDVRMTGDGRLVCLHDETLDRTTNGSGPLRALTLAQLRELDAGQGERVPTLEEAIETVRGRAVLQIELKEETAVVPTLWVLKAVGLGPEEVVLSSFHAPYLEAVRAARPDLPLSLLFGNPPEDAIERVKALGATGFSVQFRHLTPEVVEQAHAAGLEIRAYNPDTREEMGQVLDLGVDGVGSNRPDILLDLLRERGLR